MIARRTQMVAGILGGLALGSAVVFRSTWIGPAIGIVALLAAALLFIRRASGPDRVLGLVLLAAVTARLSLIALDVTLGLFPKLDALGYHRGAATLAEAWWTGQAWQHMGSLSTATYEVIVAPLYFWFGASPLLARTFNVALATVATYNVFRIGRETFGRQAGLWGAGAFAVLPSIVRVHGEQLREAAVVLVITQAVYVLLSRRFDKPAVVVSFGASMTLLALLRRASFVVLLAPVAVVILQDAYRRLASRQQAAGGGASDRPVLVAILLGLLALSGAGAWWWLQGGNVFFTDWLAPERLADIRSLWATGGSGYLTGVVFDSWWDVVTFVPVGATYFVLTPLPWQAHTPLALFAVVENLFLFYPLVLLAIPSFRRAVGNPEARALVVLLLVAVSLYGLIEGNVGTAVRHRAQFTWIIFLFTGKTIADWWDQRNRSTAQLTRKPKSNANRGPAGAR